MNLPVTVYISTRNRYEQLFHAIQSITFQTQKPSYLVVFDDGEHKDFVKDPIFNHLFFLLSKFGIQWKIIKTPNHGQLKNHFEILNPDNSPTEFIWRMDDDDVADPFFLEKVFKLFEDPKVGGASGRVIHGATLNNDICSPDIKDCLFKFAPQWGEFDNIIETQHFYNTFVYRKSIANYFIIPNLSRIGHREETIFSHRIFKEGYKLLVDGSAHVYHFQAGKGGIRDFNDQAMWDSDEAVFIGLLKDWGIKTNKYKLIHLDNGRGDHYAFKHILPEIREKFNDHKIIISCCYADVFFDDEDVELIDLQSGKFLGGEKYNAYKFMAENNWKSHISEAFRQLYL